MMKYTGFILAISLLGLSGCSSKRLDATASIEVPVERMFWESAREQDRGNSKLIIKRDSGVVYSACVSNIYFQGAKIAELMPGEKVTIGLNAGEYVVGEFLSGAMCSSLLKTLIVNIKPNSNNVLRVKTTYMGANGGDSLVRDNDVSVELQDLIFAK
uniref:Lipoprotein n=1 Tax=Pectobacterium carotovorum TaxID=554 RepID=A0A0K0MPB6_PECCA|nr:hypothetical protein [Pectobacterium carotovorum]AKG47453.1 hypothetical protein pA_00013 [Pectobacterium carotovorum]